MLQFCSITEIKVPALGLGFLGIEEAWEICQSRYFILGLRMQVDATVNGTSLFAPFSFQRGLQYCGVPLCSAGRVPPGQL